jgi:hypothetical protein
MLALGRHVLLFSESVLYGIEQLVPLVPYLKMAENHKGCAATPPIKGVSLGERQPHLLYKRIKAAGIKSLKGQ